MDTKEILKKFRTIAVVGCSRSPSKAANQIPQYLQQAGYRVIPINPGVDEILGEKAYRSLADLTAELKIRIEIINIFRPSEAVEPIIDQAIAIKKEFARPYVIWMQSGIKNESAAAKARDAGMTVVMDSCIMLEHMRIQAA